MFRTLSRMSTPVQRLCVQLSAMRPTVVSPTLCRRMFSEEAAPAETPKEEAPAEEVVPPLAHNKFAHVFLSFYFCVTLQPGALAFEHVKENEPTEVGEDDWFAVVQLSGTQYKLGKVRLGVVGDLQNDLLFTNKMDYDIGKQVVLNNVLLLGSKHKTIVGHPLVPNAKVLCTVEQQIKEKKVTVFKYHQRNRYSKKQGFRRQLTALRIDEIVFQVGFGCFFIKQLTN